MSLLYWLQMFNIIRAFFDQKQVNNRLDALERELILLKTQQTADFADIHDKITSRLDSLTQRNVMRDRRSENRNNKQDSASNPASDPETWKPGQSITLQ